MLNVPIRSTTGSWPAVVVDDSRNDVPSSKSTSKRWILR
jgi:hypothetical protein